MMIAYEPLSKAQRRDVARLAFMAVRAGSIPARQWRAWRRASPVRVLFMAMDPEGERAKILAEARYGGQNT